MLSKLDQKILDFCTRFSHRLQRTVGLTNYFVAKIGVAISFAGCVAQILNYFKPMLSHHGSAFSVVLEFVMTIYCTLRMIWLDQENNNLLSGSERVKTPLAYDARESPGWRLAWLFLAGFDLLSLSWAEKLPIDALGKVFALGIAIFYYFAIVQPLPPCKSKLKKWLGSISAIFSRPAEVRT